MSRKPRPITLYAPSLDKTVSNFILRPTASYANVLRDMRAALGNIEQAYPYDLKRLPIDDFADFESGKTVLVGTDYFERPLSEKERDIVVVQEGAAEEAWMDLDPAEMREYIRAQKTSQRIRVTLPLSYARPRISSLSSDRPTAASSLATIGENWSLPLDAILGFQGMVAPYGFVEDWDGRLLAALALLSEALVGQEMVACGLILERMKEGGYAWGVVGWEDVVDVGKRLYRRVS